MNCMYLLVLHLQTTRAPLRYALRVAYHLELSVSLLLDFRIIACNLIVYHLLTTRAPLRYSLRIAYHREVYVSFLVL